MKIIKNLGRILLALMIITSSVIGNFMNLSHKVEAATFFVEEVSLRSKGTSASSITYNGVEVATTYVYYLKDGKEYPVYCISPGLDGVGEHGEYNVYVDSLLTDVNIWRVITNGYPYKTISELGCETEEEAFAATKQAVYCAIFGREASWYGAIGEKGNRVRNAMAQILENARSSSNGKLSNNIEVNSTNQEWIIDEKYPNCISQTFEINSSTSYDTYTVSLEGDTPDETRILDENNNSKTTFGFGEKFKIVIPIKALKNDGNFKIKVFSKLNTKPILFGKAPTGSGLQNYALTASSYEDAEGSKNIYYQKNETKIEIIKQDYKTLEPLEGVEFRILDSEKKPAYTSLVTDKQGRIILTNLIPGKYYLEEVKAKEGYIKYDKQIEFDLELNQTMTVRVNNTVENKTEIVENKQDINVVQSKAEISVKNNQELVTKTSLENTIDVQNKSKIENTLETEINVSNKNSSEIVQNVSTNISTYNGTKKLPKTGM